MNIIKSYENKTTLNGENIRDKKISYKNRFFNNSFKNIPEYEAIKIGVSDDISYELYDTLIYSEDSYKKLVDIKTILFSPNTPEDIVFEGQYIRPQRQGGLYMLVSTDKQYSDKLKGGLMEVTETLRWYNDNGVLIERPVVISASFKGGGLDEDNRMILLDGNYEVKIPHDDETEKIDEGFEFIVGKRFVYRLTHIESIENETLYTWKIEKYEINKDKANFDIGVANYTDRQIFTIEINENDIAMTIGQTLQLNAIVKDKDGLVVDKPVKWSKSGTNISINPSGLVTAISDGLSKALVEMEDNSDVKTETDITVSAVLPDNYDISLTPDTDIIKLSEVINFNAQLLNNGIDTTDAFTFSIIGGSAISTDYDFEVIDSNNFKLTNNNNGGDLIIRCQSGIHILDKTIELKWLDGS